MKAPSLASFPSLCGNCRYYQPQDADAGFCRRYPPGAQLIQDEESGEWIPAPVWVVVPADEWCGEWKADQ